MLPPTIIFDLLFIALLYQAIMFGLGKTVYPRYAAFYNMAVGVVVSQIIAGFISDYIISGAISTGAISFGSLWMFIMLLKDLPKSIEE